MTVVLIPIHSQQIAGMMGYHSGLLRPPPNVVASLEEPSKAPSEWEPMHGTSWLIGDPDW